MYILPPPLPQHQVEKTYQKINTVHVYLTTPLLNTKWRRQSPSEQYCNHGKCTFVFNFTQGPLYQQDQQILHTTDLAGRPLYRYAPTQLEHSVTFSPFLLDD